MQTDDKKKQQKMNKWSILLSVIAILAISAVGTVLLRVEQAEQNVIMVPEREYIENPEAIAAQALAKVNINTASKEELMLLDEVGEARADAIIAYREQQPFQKAEDIMNISGIGEKTYEQMADKICVE